MTKCCHTCHTCGGVGDKNQRYEVQAIFPPNTEHEVMGWTDRADGGELVGSVEMHPSWHSPRVIDREVNNEQV